MRGGVIVRGGVSDSEVNYRGWRMEGIACTVGKGIGTGVLVKRREMSLYHGLVLEDIFEKGNLSSSPVLTSRKAERLRRSDQARFPQEGQDRMSLVYCLGRS